MANTCCPQYTIRLDAIRFDAGKDKKMRYLLNRWKRFVLEGNKPGDQDAQTQQSAEKPKGKQKSK
jgi:arginine-tRNA-protein transferase